MKNIDKHPALYQVNARVYLKELSQNLNKDATLDDIPDSFFDELVDRGFVWLYLLSVWKTGDAGREVSRSNQDWLNGFRQDLPDLQEGDISGSGFAITGYSLNPVFGKAESLARLREKLHKRGIKLMLDFVPNHTALDHPWVSVHPEYYVQGTEESLSQAPHNYVRLGEKTKTKVFAYGRDPYFSGWPDTLQLNYGDAGARKAMLGELMNVADMCDGVRCDMAMLVLPEIFQRTWNIEAAPFWKPSINAVRTKHPDFVFMGEVYWDMEWQLQQEGFDFTYDKRLYDRLRQGDGRLVREHFWADFEYQLRCARFLENHDEPRVASLFDIEQHKAAALITFFAPGLRFFHQGQLDGWKRKLSVHLSRRYAEQPDREVEAFYAALLNCLKQPIAHNGHWSLLECLPAWEGNGSCEKVVAFAWTDHNGDQLTVIVNYAPHPSQAYVKVPLTGAGGNLIEFSDQLKRDIYLRESASVMKKGLYIDLPAWGYHVFAVKPVERAVLPSERPREKALSSRN